MYSDARFLDVTASSTTV